MTPSDAPPPGPLEPEFVGFLAPLAWLEFAEEAALAAGEAWRESATVFADLGRAQALMMTDSFGRMMALATDTAQAMLGPPHH